MVEGSSEKENLDEEKLPPKTGPERLTRRDFLKKGGIAGAGLLVLSQIPDSSSIGLPPSGVREYHPPPMLRPEGLPEDVLSNEALREARITIYQTSNVQLYLRKNALELPIFEAAREGKIAGVVISLVDHPNLSWNASEKLPPDARLVWRAFTPHPDEYWQEKIASEEESLPRWREYERWDGERLEKLLSGEEEKEIRKRLAEARKYAEEDFRKEYWRQRVNELEEELQKVLSGEKKKKYEQGIAKTRDFIKESEGELAILRNRSKAIAREAEETGGIGQFIRVRSIKEESTFRFEQAQTTPKLLTRVENLLKTHPELHNKVFIFIAIGGKHKPRPSQSYLKPEMFKEYPWIPTIKPEERELYHRWSEPRIAGTALWHEVFHYAGETTAEEYEADTKVFDSIGKAWKKFQETGDSSGYSFVFVTKEGITLTRKRSTPETPKAAGV